MISSLRRTINRSAIRRTIATLLALAVMLGVAEPIFGEAHEREGARVTVVVNTLALPSMEMSTCADGAVAAQTHIQARSSLPMHAGDFGKDPHSAHICHCTHVHGGVPVSVGELNGAWNDWAAEPANVDDLPTSVGREPGLRPPASALIA
eukprot:TRINITY_DN80028_c0_g1_i1.p2 TRINITY_DN80028_c0_g1~~TRINITY_DN80028_c0_g1_i1.p2  ORF type:complete len:150 (+),score=8.36 TRINITY_DN80028_c0_g1_i1:51-500(+)